MIKYRLAVVVPVFNGALFLQKKISEAKKVQKNFHAKYYFVDDGSTDATASMLSAVPSVTTVHHNKNQGLFIARQTGLQQALRNSKNTHFLFSDADDRIFLQTLNIFEENVKKHPNTIQMFSFSNKKTFFLPYKDTSKILKFSHGKPYFYAPHVFVYVIPREKTNWFLSSLKYKGKFEDGFVSHPFLLANYKKIFFSPAPLFQKVARKDSIMHDKNCSYLDDVFLVSKFLIQKTSFYPHKPTVAFIVLQDMFSHLFLADRSFNYSLRKQWRKVREFINQNFTSVDIKKAWWQLTFPRKVLWILLKLRFFILISLVFKLWQKFCFDKLIEG